jgi:hypothetical protein
MTTKTAKLTPFKNASAKAYFSFDFDTLAWHTYAGISSQTRRVFTTKAQAKAWVEGYNSALNIPL